jgi:hypothetical protein
MMTLFALFTGPEGPLGHCLIRHLGGFKGWVWKDSCWISGLGWDERLAWNFRNIFPISSRTVGTLES